MKDFRDLQVWEKAHALTLEIYQATKDFPQSELYGLTNQIRRAAVSIPSNIAEGCGRGSDQDFSRFLQIAFGSANEVEYQFLLAHDLTLLDQSAHTTLENNVTEIKKMLIALIRKLKADR